MAEIAVDGQSPRPAALLRPRYVAAAGAGIAVMIAAILAGNLWFLNFVHVMAGALWTGIDLFLGFVIGPVMRSVSLDTRRATIAVSPAAFATDATRVPELWLIPADGKPRPLHVRESLETIDFTATSVGAIGGDFYSHAGGGSVRQLADCAYFTVEERRTTGRASGGGNGRCSIVVCLSGQGRLTSVGGDEPISAMQTLLVPARAGPWTASASNGDLRLLVAQPA